MIAAYYHAVGDDEAAVNTVRNAFTHADALRRHPTLISNLVANGNDALHLHLVERLAPNVCVADVCTVSGDGARAATRMQVEGLISVLLDKHTIEEGFALAMLGERMLQLDMMTQIIGGSSGGTPPPTLWARAMNYSITPLLTLDVVQMLRYQTSFARVMGKPYAQVAPAVAFATASYSLLDQVTHPFSRISVPSLESSLWQAYRARAMRQMAGIALAIRLYEIDHGHRPQQLSELIPEYLTRLPRDPFGDGQGTYIYRPGADPPVLYSIGSNGTDDGGALLWPRDKGDVPFFLDGKRPKRIKAKTGRAPQSSEAVDDNHNTEDAEGQGEEDQSGQDQP